jgi:peptide/nickel transport system substrate-binding protein
MFKEFFMKHLFRYFRKVFLGVFLLGLGISAFASGQKTGTAGTPKKAVNIGISNTAVNASPLSNLDGTQRLLSDLNFITLAEYKDDLTFGMLLAESITTADNVKFVIKINSKAKWSDGKPITADDVIYTFELYVNPEVGSTWSSYFSAIAGLDDIGRLTAGKQHIDGIRKIDEYTVEVTTKRLVSLRDFNFNIALNLHTVPKHVFEKFDIATINQNEFLRQPTVISGPYKLVEFSGDQYMRLEANKDYFLGAPKIDEVNYKVLSNANIVVQLQTGDIDIAIGGIDTEDYPQLKSDPKLVTELYTVPGAYVLSINAKTFTDPRVRRAINLAIDRETIVNKVLNGYAEVAYNLFPEGNVYNDDSVKAAYNPEKARALIKEANYDVTKRVVFTVPTSSIRTQNVAEFIAQQLKDNLNLNVVIEKSDFASSYSKAKQQVLDMYICSPGASLANPIYTVLNNIYSTNGSLNMGALKDNKVDELLRIAVEDVDENKKIEAVRQLWGRLEEVGPTVVGLYAVSNVLSYNKKLKNIEVPKNQSFAVGRSIGTKWEIIE